MTARQCASMRPARAAGLVFGILTLAFLTVTSAQANTYGGSATGAAITVPATGTTVRAATGTQPIAGGGAEAALLVGDIPSSATGGVAGLSAGTMHSAIVGLDATRGEASMENITLTISNNTITADFLMARGTAACGPAVAGNSILTNLHINGTTITVTGNANQTVTLPNGTAVINEQTSSLNGTSAAITVNALHVTTTDPVTHQQLADAILAQAAPQFDCSGSGSPNSDFGTGGGWLLAPDGIDKATFGVVGGNQPNSTTSGHVVYQDHSATSVTFRSTQIDTVDNLSDPCGTTIHGYGELNGVPGTEFTVTIHDGGEPGAGNDVFNIQAGAYSNGGTLVGGNIQKHNQACPQ